MTQATRDDAGVLDTIRDLVNHACAATVFGNPISQDGLMVLPVAKVRGGGGGGSGSGPADGGHEAGGIGGGLGVSAKPLGVYVIRAGEVSWRPAIDVNRMILGAQIVAATALLVLRALIKARTHTSR